MPEWSFCLPSGDDIGKSGGAKANFSLHRQYWHRQRHNTPVCPSPSEGVQRSAILASHGRLLKGLGHNDLCADPSWGLQSTVWMVLQTGLRITSLICQGSHFYHSDFGMITYTWICSFVLVRMSTYPFPALLILLVFFFLQYKRVKETVVLYVIFPGLYCWWKLWREWEFETTQVGLILFGTDYEGGRFVTIQIYSLSILHRCTCSWTFSFSQISSRETYRLE